MRYIECASRNLKLLSFDLTHAKFYVCCWFPICLHSELYACILSYNLLYNCILCNYSRHDNDENASHTPRPHPTPPRPHPTPHPPHPTPMPTHGPMRRGRSPTISDCHSRGTGRSGPATHTSTASNVCDLLHAGCWGYWLGYSSNH